MQWYFVWLVLACYTSIIQVKTHQQTQAASDYVTTECCSCHFEDTHYMNPVCGDVNSFMTLVQHAILSKCDIADPCRRLGRDEAPNENEWYKICKVNKQNPDLHSVK